MYSLYNAPFLNLSRNYHQTINTFNIKIILFTLLFNYIWKVYLQKKFFIMLCYVFSYYNFIKTTQLEFDKNYLEYTIKNYKH